MFDINSRSGSETRHLMRPIEPERPQPRREKTQSRTERAQRRPSPWPFTLRRTSLTGSFAAAILVLSASPMPAQEPSVAAPPAATPVVAFVDVNVVPMDRERVLERQTVIVRDGRIAQIGPVAGITVPAGALRVDGRGKYLMPGFAEMHGHLPFQSGPVADATLFLYVANGVTFVRGMQGNPVQLEMRRAIERGELLGPTLVLAGPQLSGNSAPDAAAAARLVAEQKAAGFDLLKIQEGLSPAAYDAAVAAAREHRIPFGGHVPNDVGVRRAMAAGQSTVDHLDNFVEDLILLDGQRIPEGPELTRRIAAAAGETRRAGVAVVPTMPLWEILLLGGDSAQLAQRQELQYMPPATVANWFNQARSRSQAAPQRNRQIIQIRNRLLKAMSDSGVQILFGTDAPQVFSVPGFSIHREMRTMAAAGMSPWQIMVSGTRAVAAHLGTPNEFGTVEVGRRADLILVDANPLTDVGNVARRSGVMVRGLWLPETEIQSRLSRLAASYRQR